VDDEKLKQAVQEMIAGLVDVSLGNGLYKKRVGRKGWRKRNGFRTLLAFEKNQRVIFLFGFAKKEKNNVEDDQLVKLKNMAKEYLDLLDAQIEQLINRGWMVEVK
jgi:hypothetical protein